MTDLVNFSIKDNIAIIALNRAPVNSLGHGLRQEILDSFNKAIADDTAQAIIITSTSKLFCAGADISEFGTDQAFATPGLPDLCNTIEASPKIVVAALNGTALGGGCELALACDYRFAHPNAKLGLPEVHLGLLPGAGGTQRMPRLANTEVALNMIVSGNPVSVKSLAPSGVIDAIQEDQGDFLASTIAYAKTLVEEKAPVKSCKDIHVEPVPEDFFENFRTNNARVLKGFFAPERCIQAVEAASSTELSEGLRREAELFQACMNTAQARAQQHLFFAERAATKVPGVDPKTPIRKIKKVAVIGSGTMGGGIAMNFVNAGIPTTILDLNAEALERGIGVIRQNYEISAKKGRLTSEQVEQRISLLSSTTQYSDIADTDLVIEAVFENIDTKKKVFATLDATCKEGAILATNTSTLDVNEIASVTNRPQDVVGLHFFSPANVMRLLEIVKTDSTVEDVIITTLKMAQAIGKVPVVVGVCFGFVGNRMLEPYGREANRLLLEGASPEQVDKAITNFGMAMGPLSMSDLAGIDVGYLVRESRRDQIGHEPSYQLVQDELYKLDRYGQKTGRGNYIYEGRNKSNDPEVLDLSKKLASQLGIEQRDITDQEIIERTIYMLVNEAAYILEEGIAYRSSDCDIVYVNGYGFPAWRGGPMQYADEIGLDIILGAIEKHRSQLGEYGEHWFQPAPLLKKLVSEGRTFNSYINEQFS